MLLAPQPSVTTSKRFAGGAALALIALPCLAASASSADAPPSSAVSGPEQRLPEQLLDKYCSRCHNDERLAGDMSLSTLHASDLATGANLAQWEKILRMTSRGEMPPRTRPQPTSEARADFTHWLETSLDDFSAAHPNPGRATLRRLNRAEYANAVRDLLAINVDVSKELPADDSGYGFDNISDVLSVSPTLMDRYLAVAGKLSRLAVGLGPRKPFVTSYTIPKDGSIKNQGIPSYNERMSDDLPLDSRGGAAFSYYAPHDGTYELSGYLNANTNNEVDRLKENRISLRVPLKSGQHTVGIAFRKQLALDETVQSLHNTTDVIVLPTDPPTQIPVDFVVDGARVGQTSVPSYHISPRFSQANFPRDVLQIDVEGPFDAAGPGNTPSRQKIFACQPSSSVRSEESCAKKILTTLTRQAYRRPVANADIAPLMKIYAMARTDSDFDHGIEAAVEAVLVSPSFLFLHENDPVGSAPGSVHPVSDLEYASRLALFLWSSLPDEELLDVAAKGKLRKPAILEKQLARMLADPRAEALTTNFAGQWLYLRNLEYQRPDVFLFPQFDTRLRGAMKRETEMFFTSVVRENRSVLDFIRSDYTFVNQRLAEHYGIAGVKGTAFRKVRLEPQSQRGGLLGQGSILTVTSYGNHTSAVKRGKWILDNLLAAAPPPPPPDVPALKFTQAGRQLNAREQMELHRSDPACASCHVKMDPLGLSLEHFDAVGAYRTQDAGRPIDASAKMPDGAEFDGIGGLQKILLDHKDEFTQAFTERLMTYALGRGLEPYDQPKVRAIARSTALDDYRIRTLILGIVKSEPFNLRRTPDA
jgi:mono/diheme cytochrome c family protein